MIAVKDLFPSAIILLGLCLTQKSFAQTAHYFLKNYLEPLKTESTPILYAECSLEYGKAIIVFPFGNGKAQYIELARGKKKDGYDPQLVNAGEFTVDSKVELDSVILGGPGSYHLRSQIIEYLLGTRFRFVYPKDVYSIVGSKPKTTCKPKMD